MVASSARSDDPYRGMRHSLFAFPSRVTALQQLWDFDTSFFLMPRTERGRRVPIGSNGLMLEIARQCIDDADVTSGWERKDHRLLCLPLILRGAEDFIFRSITPADGE